MSAPLTSAKLGSTRCVGCEKLFTKTPELETVATVANVSDGYGTSPSGKTYRRLGRHDVTRLWHTTCLADFEASNEAYRQRVAADNQALVERMRAAIEAGE